MGSDDGKEQKQRKNKRIQDWLRTVITGILPELVLSAGLFRAEVQNKNKNKKQTSFFPPC